MLTPVLPVGVTSREFLTDLEQLLRRFDFALVDPTKPWTSINVGVFIQYDYWVKAYKRQ